MRIFCTGATGFVGRHLIPHLQERGHEVTALVRTTVPWIKKSVVSQSLPSESEWRSLLGESDVVCHLAAIPAAGRRSDMEIVRVNTETTIALARAAAQCGLKLLFLSSIKVLGEETRGSAAFSESDSRRPQDSYAQSKAMAEQAIVRLNDDAGAVILRSPLVYGPDMKGHLLRMLRWVHRGLPLPFASVMNLRSLTYVGNLTNAIATLVEDSSTRGVYHVADDEEYSTPDLVERIAHSLNRPRRIFPFPPPLLETLGDIVRRGEMVRKLTRSLRVATGRIRSELNWAPPYSSDLAFGELGAWYRRRAE